MADQALAMTPLAQVIRTVRELLRHGRAGDALELLEAVADAMDRELDGDGPETTAA